MATQVITYWPNRWFGKKKPYAIGFAYRIDPGPQKATEFHAEARIWRALGYEVKYVRLERGP